MIPTLVWEFLPSGEERAKVVGGWVIRTIQIVQISELDKFSTFQSPNFIDRSVEHTSLCFVPDPNHQWDKELDMEALLLKQGNHVSSTTP